MRRLLRDLPAAVRHWRTCDPVLARMASRNPPTPDAERRSGGFHSLVTSLIHQQVSTAAGRSIFRKLTKACGGHVTPQRVLRLSDADLQGAGVSRQKRRYLRDLARRVESKKLDFRRLRSASDEDVIAALTEVDGIGVWTAKMFLLFHLERPNVMAPEDLGLRLAVMDAYGVRADRAARFLEERAAVWAPHSSLACLALWAHKDAAKTKRATP